MGKKLGMVALIVPLIIILGASGWYAAGAWISVQGPPMPAIGYLAMTLGALFSLIIGCGLMALLFYSSRHGYDEPYEAVTDIDEFGNPAAPATVAHGGLRPDEGAAVRSRQAGQDGPKGGTS